MRLFVAIELSDRVRSGLGKVQAHLAQECDKVRWIPPHQVHMTVKFLGEVPDPDVDRVARALQRAAGTARPCAMDIGGCGCFPARGLVRIVWAGASEETGALLKCVGAVEAELAELGFPKERKSFTPHITIGRVRQDRSGGRIRSAVEAYEFPLMDQEISSLTLMSSVLSPKGPTYTPVSRATLGDTDRQR